MPMIVEGMPCLLCQGPLERGQHLFSTWGVWLEPSSPMWKCCDAALHFECYEKWEYRREFAKSYVDFWAEGEKENLIWHRAFHDELGFVTVNPVDYIASTWVHLVETGSRIPVKLEEWETWLVSHDPELYPLEFEAVEALKKNLRAAGLRNGQDVVDATNWDRKTELFEKAREAERQRKLNARKQQEESLKAKAENNDACRRLIEVLKSEGRECPKCGEMTRRFNLIQRKKKRYGLQCGKCQADFDPSEFG